MRRLFSRFVAISSTLTLALLVPDLGAAASRTRIDAYPAPDCLEPASTSGGVDHFKQGMSAGWTDEYNWFLPGQYVEVSGVPDGDYILDTTVDPTVRLVEEDKSNNCSAVRVRLSQMGTPNALAELLGPVPACEAR